MFDERSYHMLSPAEKEIADQVTHFCYDILDILGQTITANLKPRQLQYLGTPLDAVYWVIEFETPAGKKGGLSLRVEIKWVNNPDYKNSVFRQIVTCYADHLYNHALTPAPDDEL